MAPLVVKGKVLVGNSGGEMGVRGWLKALDASTGKVVWTAYSTGPDKDVLIGPRFKPFYAKDRGKDLGVTHLAARTRGRSAAARCGAGSPTTPTLDLIYYGTANPGPVEPRAAARRQQVDVDALRARPGHRRGGLGLPDRARTTCTTTTASTRASCSTCRSAGQPAQGARCIPSATATST